MVTTPRDLIVGLSSWIIQDGNYPDFERNQQASFALEFDPVKGLQVGKPETPPSITLINSPDCSARYNATGRVVHVADDWWVVDFGLLAFREDKSSKHTFRADDCVRGEISFGIDPFFYFERLARQDDAPALIYDWTIAKIEMQTAPRIETKPKYFERDPRLLGWRAIEQTDAWHDDDGGAEYLLHCRRNEVPPRRRLRR
jgi:hypothetical protein